MMKNLVLIVLMIVGLLNCRNINRKLKRKIGVNEYFTYSFIPSTDQITRRMKEGEDVVINESVQAGEMCDVEVRDYKQIKICGCKYWGFRCQTYKYYVDENYSDRTKIQP